MQAMRNGTATEVPPSLRLWVEPEPVTQRGSIGQIACPRDASKLGRHYDLTISRPCVDMEAFTAFDGWLASAAALRNLSCCILTDAVVQEATERLQSGRLQIGFHLDYFSLWHIPDDPYARLARAVRDSGGHTINPPAKSRLFTNKAEAHERLRKRGLGVPATALVSPETEIYESILLAAGLGLDGTSTYYVKPANGFGSSGVLRVENGTFDRIREAITQVRQRHAADTLLVQRAINCPRLRADDGANRIAYWRLVHCMGEIIPFWWCAAEAAQGRPSYRRLTGAEIKRLQLQDVIHYCHELADLCQMSWFSTELCASETAEDTRFRVPGPDGKSRSLVAIDYVNDQCDVDVQSRWLGGPPDDFVRHVANRFAEAARARKNCLRLTPGDAFNRRVA
jgi:hypothetical protein